MWTVLIGYSVAEPLKRFSGLWQVLKCPPRWIIPLRLRRRLADKEAEHVGGFGLGVKAFFFWGRGAEVDPETGALPFFAFEAYLAAHALDSFSNDGKADAGSGVLLVCVQALKEAENLVAMLCSNADSVVLHPDANVPVGRLSTNGDPRRAVAGDKLQRITQKI